MTHTLTIPGWLPARLNELLGGHWGKSHRLKKADAEIVYVYAYNSRIPHATGRRFVRLHFVLGKYTKQGDADGWQKSILDALVRCGLLLDDSPRWCEWSTPTFERGDESATVITLEDVQ